MSVDLTRRDFVGKGLAGVVGASAILNGSLGFAIGNSPRNNKIARLGIIGPGGRGTALLNTLITFPDIQINAVCDINPKRVEHVQALVKKAKGNTPEGYSNGPLDYKNLLKRDDIDAVMITTPVEWHIPMSIDAMKAGKDVGSEVPAGDTLQELWNLVKTKEKTGRHYMLLENYNYTRDRLQVFDMVRKGVFGDPYYAECGYIHDCKSLCVDSKGHLTWRGERARDRYEHPYTTHSLGPVSKWFGINEGDRMEYMTTMMTKPRSLHLYAKERFGKDSPAANVDFKRGDFYTTTIHTAQGRVIRLDFDYLSNRPTGIYYLMQGTKGIFNSRTGIYLEGNPETYKPASAYQAEYDHPYWKELGGIAGKTGHGGGDYFVLKDFVEMVKQDKEPWIDVYDAATWSSVADCSKASLDNRSKVIELPDFTNGKWKDPDWRKDHLKPGDCLV